MTQINVNLYQDGTPIQYGSRVDAIFTFLTQADVPPDDSASERAGRNVKVKTKVFGRFRNKDGKGAGRYAKIRSVTDTAIKNGQDEYAASAAPANCEIMELPELTIF